MAKIKAAVFDAGPFIHLHEIKSLKFIKLFAEILITEEISQECEFSISIVKEAKNVSIIKLKPENKNFAKYLMEKYKIHLGEATGIALCKQEGIKLFFTDDLNARETAKIIGFEPHGTLAIILRAYKNRIIKKKEAFLLITELYEHSSLFLTRDLYDWILKEIEQSEKNN